MVSKDIVKAINDERIFYARVTKDLPARGNFQEMCILDVPLAANGQATSRGCLYLDEADSETELRSMMHLVGLTVPIVVKGVDEKGTLVCSRKLAQQKLKQQMMRALKSGQAFDGTIVHFATFGAFVEVQGLIGYLRNGDYSLDHSKISERYKTGDHITVRCKSISSDGKQRISWEAVTKFRRTAPYVLSFEPGALILGRVVDVRNFAAGPAVFVRLYEDGQELDVMCAMPPELEVERGVSVVIRIQSIEPGENPYDRPRIRGRIMRLA